MNLDQQSVGFQATPRPAATTDSAADSSPAHVVIVATLLNATDASHFIDLNGTRYEVASEDVIDIQFPALSSAPAPAAESSDSTNEQAPPKEEAEGQPAQEGSDKDEPTSGPRLALVKIKPTAVLIQHVQVPAILVAAAGTWLAIVPSDQAAEQTAST
ncbi:hypothetical protein [Blastochloris viridis]|uniref:Uncharacterized protein n=1 Tax=Blastochloris viridis TaxID=1079 RepID=A0A0P0ITS1_BLAVI|nr:hypothetical protein [Blastochloris viridis]ALK10602.1 hypothetical protein BVIR_2838 [Blastochloris viridis]CUU43265.1 hypothetical protein BVIRIDIS_22830 [Blastochloris viridis]